VSKGEGQNPGSASTDGRLIYAVGDIHGRLDLLDRLLGLIHDDLGHRKLARPPMLVFVGDYVDRGPASRGVVQRLLALRASDTFEVRTLKGNHEQAMLQFLGDAARGPEWVSYGGGATLSSYGVAPPALDADDAAWETARQALAAAIPEDHLDFLWSLELSVAAGDYLFVHAGVRPDVALDEQKESDLLWIRDDFLSAPGPFGKVVVHGHTPREEAFVGPHRISLDTGASMTGVLTAVRLGDGEPALIQTLFAPRPAAATTPRPDRVARLKGAVGDALNRRAMIAAARRPKAGPDTAPGAEPAGEVPATAPQKSAVAELAEIMIPSLRRSAALVALLVLSFVVLIYSFAVN
jgi:serine/threonine protein phosphatase 1